MIKRSIICLSLVAALLVPGILLAQQGTVKVKDGEKIYIIKKGDTLWHISERFLEDPFKWPVLWEHNDYINNPHLIYPGDRVRITPDGLRIIERKERAIDDLPAGLPVARLEPPVIVPPPPVVVTPPAVTVESSSIGRVNFITKDEFETSGVILRSKEEGILLGQNDHVFVAFEKGTEVMLGDRFAIYDVGDIVRHPVTGRKAGYLTEMLGIAKVTSVGHVVEAKIEAAYREIEKGAKLKVLEPPVNEVVVRKPEVSVDGVVLATMEEKGGVAEKDIIYIDRGAKEGLKVGDVMYLYRNREKVRNPMGGGKVVLPPYRLGELILVSVKDSTSSAYIVKSLKPSQRGDIVSTEVR